MFQTTELYLLYEAVLAYSRRVRDAETRKRLEALREKIERRTTGNVPAAMGKKENLN